MKSNEQNQQLPSSESYVLNTQPNQNQAGYPPLSPYPQFAKYSQHSNYSAPQQAQNEPIITPQLNIQEDNTNVCQGNQLFYPVMQVARPQQLNQIQPYEIHNDQQPFLDPASNYIKDLPFAQQKNIFISILLLFLVWPFLEIFFCFALYVTLGREIGRISPVMFPLSLVALYVLAKIGTLKKSRQPAYSTLIFLGLIYLTAQTLLSFCLLFSNKGYDSATAAQIVMMVMIFQGFLDIIVTILLLIFVCAGSTKILIAPVLYIIVAASAIAIFELPVLMLNCSITLIYTLLTYNSLNQIKKGRFELKADEVLVCVNAAYYGYLVPIDF